MKTTRPPTADGCLFPPDSTRLSNHRILPLLLHPHSTFYFLASTFYPMSLKVGLVGLPNAGKSTLFTALTRVAVPAENYPFCTIDPNVGVVPVPDTRLEQLDAISKSDKIIPTTIEFVDIAGLVKGASAGEGLGNKFLSHIREVDAIAMVLRAFTDPNVIHVHGTIDPTEDREVLTVELALADLQVVSGVLERTRAKLKSGPSAEVNAHVAVLERLKAALQQSQPAREVKLTPEEEPHRRELMLLTAKPLLLVYNVGEGQTGPAGEISLCAKVEAELAALPDAERDEYMSALGVAKSGLDQLITAAYGALDLITFFTTGPKETRAWTVRRNTLAPQAAGVIHSDFEAAFIRAEVVPTTDFITLGGETACRDAGKLRIEGKTYAIQDGDICHFRVGV
jgi:ribosome-binding ATPase YchF (GTP1/OBG family)